MKNKRGEKGLGIFEYIKKHDNDGLLRVNLDFSMEMFGNTQIVLYGCRRILKYTYEEMILEAKNFDVSISGSCLNCAAYHIQGVEISGNIEDIKFILRG